jgi:hypothetical protein
LPAVAQRERDERSIKTSGHRRPADLNA